MFRWLGKLQKYITRVGFKKTVAAKHTSTHQKNRIKTSYSRTNKKPIETTKPTQNSTLTTTQHLYRRKQLIDSNSIVQQNWTHHLLTRSRNYHCTTKLLRSQKTKTPSASRRRHATAKITQTHNYQYNTT
jgi:hypothetical protein